MQFAENEIFWKPLVLYKSKAYQSVLLFIHVLKLLSVKHASYIKP